MRRIRRACYDKSSRFYGRFGALHSRDTEGLARNFLTAMAHELVTENGVGESAAAVGRQIQTQHSNILASITISPEPTPVIEDLPLIAPLIVPVLTVPGVVNAPKFGSRPPAPS